MTSDGDYKMHRCSCGSLVALCNGEYHDCATERMVAHQKRQAEALESIAECLRALRASPALRIAAALECVDNGTISATQAIQLIGGE